LVKHHGHFVWYELMTTDMEAAKAFYADVVGWGTQDASMPGMPYTLFTAGKTSVSGIVDLPEDARKLGMRPSWLGYVGVDDVDATAAHLHLARTVCRRAERLMVELNDQSSEGVTPAALKYVNRLSDFLFVAGRHANDKGASDVLWQPGQNR